MGLSRRLFLATAGAGAMGVGSGASSAAVGVGAPVPLMSSYIAGSDRYAAPSLLEVLARGTMVELKREPENRYDSRAVSIWTIHGDKLGYVPRIHNQPLANLIEAGIVPEAEISQIKGPPERPDITISVAIALRS